MLETDAAPQPFKSKRENWTEPRHVATVAQTLAELKGIDVEEVEEVTTRNMRRVLGTRWDTMLSYLESGRVVLRPDQSAVTNRPSTKARARFYVDAQGYTHVPIAVLGPCPSTVFAVPHRQ